MDFTGVSTSMAITSVRGTITSRATLSRKSNTAWMSSEVDWSDGVPALAAYSASARSISSSGGGAGPGGAPRRGGPGGEEGRGGAPAEGGGGGDRPGRGARRSGGDPGAERGERI